MFIGRHFETFFSSSVFKILGFRALNSCFTSTRKRAVRQGPLLRYHLWPTKVLNLHGEVCRLVSKTSDCSSTASTRSCSIFPLFFQECGRSCLTALKIAKVDIANWDCLLAFLCSTKLSKLTLALWDHLIPSEIPGWEEFMTFLQGLHRTLEAIEEFKPTMIAQSRPTWRWVAAYPQLWK